jgi:hypothetical protein
MTNMYLKMTLDTFFWSKAHFFFATFGNLSRNDFPGSIFVQKKIYTKF